MKYYDAFLKNNLLLLLIVILFGCGKPEHIQYQGYVEGENIFLASPFSGILVKQLVSRGQAVKKNELLLQLDPNPQQLTIVQAQNELQEAQRLYKDLLNPKRKPEIEAIKAQIKQVDAQIELAEIRVRRFRDLYARQATDKDSLDETVAHYNELKHLKSQHQSNLELALLGSREERIKAQKAKIDALKATLDESKWQLTQKSIYAPVSGKIFETYYIEGEFVKAQQPIASLLAPENVRIEFFIPVKELNRIKVGQKINFTCMNCSKTFQALISYVSPEAEYIPPLVYSRENEDKLVFRIKAKILEPELFKPGQPITVTGLINE